MVSKQARYAQRLAVKKQAAAAKQSDLFAAAVRRFEGRLLFRLLPVADLENAIGISIGVSDDSVLSELETWGAEIGQSLPELLAMLGNETARRVAHAHKADVVVTSVVGKMVNAGDASTAGN